MVERLSTGKSDVLALKIFLWHWLKPLWGAQKLPLCMKNPVSGGKKTTLTIVLYVKVKALKSYHKMHFRIEGLIEEEEEDNEIN